ncbi:MAG: integrase core domain-containing protein, partial [Thermoplasmata archaeon]
EFGTYEEANRAIKEAYKDYNEERPHSAIGYMSPNEFINRWNGDENFRKKYLNNLDKERDKRMKRMEKRYKSTEYKKEVIISV